MGIVSVIREAISDLTSLKVATLYGSSITLESGIDTKAKAEIEQQITAQQGAVDKARGEWLAATELLDRMGKHRSYRDAKARLQGLQEELNGVSPSDIFGKVQLAMNHAKAAGYSRFELNGDSTHYLDSELGEGNAYLLDAHQAHVEAAQAARQRLLDTASQLLKLGEAL